MLGYFPAEIFRRFGRLTLLGISAVFSVLKICKSSVPAGFLQLSKDDAL